MRVGCIVSKEFQLRKVQEEFILLPLQSHVLPEAEEVDINIALQISELTL